MSTKRLRNNFLPRINHRNFNQLAKDLVSWNDNICNVRVHGTTRKVPLEVFSQVEHKALLPLPSQRYELFEMEKRKVAVYHHIVYKYNYSVPHEYVGEKLMMRSNGSVLRIYKDQYEIALHSIVSGKGQYITREDHKPPNKQRRSREYYLEKASQIGPSTILFLKSAEELRPRHWHEMMRGVISLTKNHDPQAVELACQRALDFGAISYQTVKNILEKGLYDLAMENLSITNLGG